jgi:hypothetical protein
MNMEKRHIVLFFVVLLFFCIGYVPAAGLNGVVIEDDTYKYVCYNIGPMTYKVNLTHNAFGFRCSVESINSSNIRIICDSANDGNGDGLCSNGGGESCVGYGFYEDSYTTLAFNSEIFSWNKA